MKLRRLSIMLASIVLSAASLAHDPKAPLDTDQKIFLTQYELARAALAADDLKGAKKATAAVASLTVIYHDALGEAPPGFVQDARKLIAATSLQGAREVFKSYSKRAIHVAELKPGYFVVHCTREPGDERDWVQSARSIGDPYSGAKMPICGALKN